MPAKSQITIGQLARKAQIPTTTLRYYERVGLLVPEDRSQANYRLYSQQSLRRLHFIRAAQAVGFTLDDIASLLGTQDGHAPSCREVQGLIEERLADIDVRLKKLHDVRIVLQSSLQKCRATAQRQRCRLIEALDVES